MKKKVRKSRKATKPSVRKASYRVPKPRQLSGPGTYVTEKHWELW